MAVLHALQVFGQRLAFGLALGNRFSCRGFALRAALALQRFELGLQAGLVSGQRFLEQLALLGAHALGPGAKTPGLQARELVRDALNLDVAQLDGVRLEVDLLALLADVSALFRNVAKHLCCHFGQCIKAQTLQVLGFEFVHVEHVCIVQNKPAQHHQGMC